MKKTHLSYTLALCAQFNIPRIAALTTPPSQPMQINGVNGVNGVKGVKGVNGASLPDVFDAWVAMRMGLSSEETPERASSDQIFWAGRGEVYENPSGRVLANFEGLDVCRAVQLENGHVRQIGRKVFWFRDPETDEIMTEFEGRPVRPVQYDAQVFDYKRGVNVRDPSMPTILPLNVVGPRIIKCPPCSARWAGNGQLLFQLPLFIDMETPRGHYQAYEFYDYCLDTSFPDDRPGTVFWSRQGPLPPFDQNNPVVMHFSGYRATAFEDLPGYIREVIEESFPLFRAPPVDMDDVHRIESARTASRK